MDRMEPVPENSQAPGGGLQSLGITIKSNQLYGRGSTGENGLGMPPLADGPVHHPTRSEVSARRGNLLEEDRDMHAIHYMAPWVAGAMSRRPVR